MTESHEREQELENVALCPACQQEQVHEILRTKESGKGEDHLVRCEGCGNVHTVVVRPPKSSQVKFTLSTGANSESVVIEVDDDEVFAIDDEFEHDSFTWRITRLQLPDSTSAKQASPIELGIVWAMRCDKIQVKLTFTDDDISTSNSILCDPDEIFTCGAIFKHNGISWRIRALHTGRGRRLTGSLPAEKIRRIFLHLPPSKEDIRERERKSRGRWKGQEFSGREEHQERVRQSNIRRRED